MFNLDDITDENNKEYNEKWPFIPDYMDRSLITGGSRSGKTNLLNNLMKEQGNIDKIYLYAKDLSETKYELLIKDREYVGIKYCYDLIAFTECSNTMDDVY